MNMYPALTNMRGFVSNQFHHLQTLARRESLWAKLMGKDNRLILFPEQVPEKSPNRRFAGTQEISVEKIVGTLNRQSDFDLEFRPLNVNLRDRWVNAYLAFDKGGWEPIVVHKVGENYYVEDGHQRVSIARLREMAFIEANVWEYPVAVKEANKSQLMPCRRRIYSNVYAIE